MAIRFKTREQIEKMRRAGRIVRLVLDRLGEMVAAGVTTEELNAVAERLTAENGARCLFKGVPGRGGAGPFPGAICASLNEEVVHGIPSPKRVIRDGDVVSIDFGVRLDGAATRPRRLRSAMSPPTASGWLTLRGGRCRSP